MKSEEVQQQIPHIEQAAKTLAQEVRVMDRRRHILEPLIRNEEVQSQLRAKFADTYGGNAYLDLVPWLAQDLLRDLARLLLDKDSRTGSFVSLFKKVSEPSVHTAMRERFGKLREHLYANKEPFAGLTEEQSNEIRDRWKDSDEKAFLSSFDQGWKVAEDALTQILADPMSEKFRTFRNKYYAHLEMAPIGQDPGPIAIDELGLRLRDPLDYADKYMGAVFELSRVLTGNVIDLDLFTDAHRRNGEDFWKILAGPTE